MDNYLKVKMTRDYGTAGKLEIELLHRKVIAHTDGLVEFNLILDQMEMLIEHFEINRLPALRPAARSDANSMIVPAERIKVSMKDGKRLYNVVCGEWREFGVPFYDEHIIACGINPAKIPDTGHIFHKGTKAVVEMKGDKPKRVINLVKA